MSVTAVPQRGFSIDPWDPGYASAVSAEALTELDARSSAELDLDREVPASLWKPLSPARGAAAPDVMLIADGVRRVDARVWVHDPGGAMPAPGIAASYAAGVVRCSPTGGETAVLAAIDVRRALFSPSPDTPSVLTPYASYPGHVATGATMEQLSLALQQQLTELEIELARTCRADLDGRSDLLLVDGPLRGRSHLPRTLGYIKTHHAAYLPAPQAAVVTDLRPGERTPVFLMGTSWRRHSWYLRLPGTHTAHWAGIVRCEAAPDLPIDEVTALADASALVLPSLAGVDYKDPRAPQNLVPIGGLEKRLRHRLGDPRLLYRALRNAAT
ncbi:hypothetical protein SAMN05421505_113164 [Sinosporangium album]|uniref:NurA domain-containing protein n=1 Tax=Sinosporangium album TaxID=504805 RepID=A0A1G8B6I5_9ACTN|nr:hypothetical protein [Sinosporangium album]SDH28754.1 hypothetical protein SAMN05421505_113164 [Sinosporangium album]